MRSTSPDRRSPRRALLWGGVAVAAVAACGIGGVAVLQPGADASADTPKKPLTSTATVDRGDLQGTTPLGGKLSRENGPSIGAGVSGTVTRLPGVDSELHARSELYRVDELPVVAFEGTLPQYRAFEPGMTDGADVQQLEDNLHNWGYFKGTPNTHFDSATTTAVRAWQKDAGLPKTGTVEVGRILFTTGTYRPSTITAKVGDMVGPGAPMYDTKRDEKVIGVDLPVGSPLARQDAPVSVKLPNGTTAPGKITEIGAAKSTDDNKTVVPIVIRLDDPAAAGTLTDASVTVEFISEERKDVLSVPVTALGAAADGGFVLEVPKADGTTTSIPVEVGLFAGDRVEVSGGRVHEGEKVLVPKG